MANYVSAKLCAPGKRRKPDRRVGQMLRRLTWAKRLLPAPAVWRLMAIGDSYRAGEQINGDDMNWLRVLLLRRELILEELRKRYA